jgi:hypothetical protein
VSLQSAARAATGHAVKTVIPLMKSRRRITFPQGLGPRQLHRLLQQGFEAGEMGFNDQFAVLLSFGSWLFSLIAGARWLCRRRMLAVLGTSASLRASATQRAYQTLSPTSECPCAVELVSEWLPI